MKVLIFLIWLGLIIGIPSIIFGESILIPGTIASCAMFVAISSASHAKDNTFKKEYIITYGHFWIFLTYAIIGMIKIAFTSIEYNDMKALSRGLVVFAVYPVIAFCIESWINERRSKKEYQKLRVGQAFEEEYSREGVPYFMHDKYLEFTRKTIWIIKELHHYNDIRLQDAHFESRKKRVTIDELKKYTRLDGVTWYRTPRYYDIVIDAIKDRAAREIYHSDDM